MKELELVIGITGVGLLCVALGYMLAHNCETQQALREIVGIKRILTKEGGVMALLEALAAEVARNTDVDRSAVVLLQGLTAKIQELIDAGADPVELQALVDSLKASTDSLAAAVTENTPAEPTPE